MANQEWYASKLKYPSGKIENDVDSVYKLCYSLTNENPEFMGTLLTSVLGRYVVEYVTSNADTTVRDKVELLEKFKDDLKYGPTTLIELQLDELTIAIQSTMEQKV